MFIPLLLFHSFLFIHAALGEIVCEHLPNEICAFSVSSSGKRCLLETMAKKGGKVEHECRTSGVVVEKMAEYIETDECIKACGVDRKAIGISSDTLLDPRVLNKLCSTACYHKCPNIIELYFNMAVGEGVFLPYLCEKQRSNPHRAMEELSSYGDAPSYASSPFSQESSRKLHPAFAPGPL
ncbi:hypothetical protein D8674_024203 [Pyrus ussuriensis x Pyrus communis]|uniref:PAR1 protein n=1 Tax=Pyrus ussuriensis x Pyrus communis TaxID=2448454 RepID=A0A5N5H744_9ROSA|nr:uncharacterized protein LOC103959642 [Pyrus x bretschneideri]KAB2622021.1 hypothetical protein D8674_024203 [Pyrus ussuriensis x Pyrus communis]